MALPPSFERRFGSEKLCRLKKSLYGLKQSPRAWFDRLSKSEAIGTHKTKQIILSSTIILAMTSLLD